MFLADKRLSSFKPGNIFIDYIFSLIRPTKFQAHLCERPMKISSHKGEISVQPKHPWHAYTLLA